MSLATTVNLTLIASAATAPDIGSTAYAISEALSLAALTSGAGLNMADYVWSDRRTLALSTAENIDMYAPAVRDALGQTLTLSKLKVLYIKNRGGSVLSSSDILKIGGESSTAAWNSIFDASDTAKTSIQPNGCLLIVAPSAAGFAIANTTNHLLKIDNTNAAQAVDYDIVIVAA